MTLDTTIAPSSRVKKLLSKKVPIAKCN